MKQRHGKKYRQAEEKIKPGTLYGLGEGVSVLKQTSSTKFDSSCEVHMNLGIDTKQADQNVRSTVVLPHGTGKKLRIIAFVPEVDKKTVLDMGAIKAGDDDLIDEIAKGFLDFDVAIAKPEMMRKLAKVAKILGQKGLMPNPKAGTVSDDVSKLMDELQKGKIEFRADKLGNLHNTFGKVSFGEQQLVENLKAYLHAVNAVRPSTIKGTYIKSITITSTMGPGIKLNVQDAIRAV